MEKYHILPFLVTLYFEKLCCPHALEHRAKGEKESDLVSGTCFYYRLSTLGDLTARESLSPPVPTAQSCLSLEGGEDPEAESEEPVCLLSAIPSSRGRKLTDPNTPGTKRGA